MKGSLRLVTVFMMLAGAAVIQTAAGFTDGMPQPRWSHKFQRQDLKSCVSVETDDPPSGTVISYSEWSPAIGTIISWHWFDDYLTELTRGFVQAGKCWIAVDNAAQQISVSAMLTAAGVPMDQVFFLIADTDTVWIVDYGPFFVSVDGSRQIVDHLYGWPQDDLFPPRLADSWGMSSYTSPLWTEGGNFFPDGQGTCFITSQVFTQNPGLTEEEIRAVYRDYCGCHTLHVLEPLADYTGHIDMFARLIDEDTMLIGQYRPADPEYQILEDNALYVAQQVSSTGSNYEVIRIPMPGEPSSYLTYTNSQQVNNHIFVPVYNIPEDEEALDIYMSILPECTVTAIDSNEAIEWGGAIHCTSKVVPDPNAQPTATPEPSITSTPTASSSDTPTPAPSVSETPVPSSTPTVSSSPTIVPTPTLSNTATHAPTCTSSPTFTSLPTSTASPTRTVTPTCTVTPDPTATPTDPSAPTATPERPTGTPEPITPTPDDHCVETGCRIVMPASLFHAGDDCYCEIHICNADSETMIGFPVFVILEIESVFFFAPSFTSFDLYIFELPPGLTRKIVVDHFRWPENAGEYTGAVWYAAITDRNVSRVIGYADLFEFGWK